MRKKKPAPVTPVAIKMDKTLKERLEKLGALKQRSVHWLMKDAINSYVDTQEEAEKLKQETLRRWEEACEGNIVQNDTVLKWLDTWGTDKEKERPE